MKLFSLQLFFWISFLILLACKPKQKETLSSLVAFLEGSEHYIHIQETDTIKIDLKYATEDNFMKKNVYKNFNRCYLHSFAEKKLRKAERLLAEGHPGIRFIIYDCLRPRRIQEDLWKHVKGTKQEEYVISPVMASIHNFGLAIDLSLLDKAGNKLDMASEYDTFTPLSKPINEIKFLKKGKITDKQVSNRFILRDAMVGAGFIVDGFEWWHFDAMHGNEARSNYKLIE